MVNKKLVVKEVVGKTRTIDFSKIPGVVDVFDDSMIGTEARKAADEAVEIMAQNICDEIDQMIIDDFIKKGH